MTLEQTLFNIVCGQCSELFLLAIQDKCTNWVKFWRDKDILKLLELIDMVCDDSSTGTNKNETYVCIAQARKFHNFIQRPSELATKFVHKVVNNMTPWIIV